MSTRHSLRVGVLLLALLAAAPARAEDEKVVDPAEGTPERVVQQALLIALEPDEPKAFKRYLALVHPDLQTTEVAVIQLRRYSWTRFRKQAPDYILEGTRGGFAVSRRDPARVEPSTEHVRLFLSAVNNARRTWPTPIRLERLGERWVISANSL